MILQDYQYGKVLTPGLGSTILNKTVTYTRGGTTWKGTPEEIAQIRSKFPSEEGPHLRTTMPVVTGPVRPPPFIEPPIGGDNVGLDLGNLLGTLGEAFIQAKYQPVALSDYAGNPNIVGGGVPVQAAEWGGGIPGGDFVKDPAGGYVKGMVYDPAANCGVGKWRKKSRRRRRRLLTASDARDLAALKNTVGPSIMKTWIATHPS